MPNSSSNAMTISTVSRESAPRSSTNDASPFTSSSETPSWSPIIFLTLLPVDIFPPPDFLIGCSPNSRPFRGGSGELYKRYIPCREESPPFMAEFFNQIKVLDKENRQYCITSKSLICQF